MSSKTTGERRCPRELSDTIRASPVAASASRRPNDSAKWPRWLVANCSSQPSSVSSRSGSAITPALLMSTSSGSLQPPTKAAMDARSARSTRPTSTVPAPVVAMMAAAVRSPASVSRTASVTAAPAPTSALAVSTPIPEEPPVTIARLPARSIPSITWAAVDSKPNGGWMRLEAVVSVMHPSVGHDAGRDKVDSRGEDLVERGEVAVRVAELARSREHLVGDAGRGQRNVELLAGLARETDVLLHELHVEPRVFREVKKQGNPRLEHRRADRARAHHLR